MSPFLNKMVIPSVLTVLLLSGCVSLTTPEVRQELNPKVYWKRDLKVTINDYESNGTLVVPKAENYTIDIDPPGAKDLVVMKTCHREHEAEKLGFWKKLEFTPMPGIEDTGLCYLEVAVFELREGRHAWALIDFESDTFQLPHRIKCNGSQYNSNGTSVCQSKEGLIQEIIFPEEVVFSDKSKCPPLPISDKKTFRFRMHNRECVYIAKGTSGRLAKLTLIGYEKLLIRELN